MALHPGPAVAPRDLTGRRAGMQRGPPPRSRGSADPAQCPVPGLSFPICTADPAASGSALRALAATSREPASWLGHFLVARSWASLGPQGPACSRGLGVALGALGVSCGAPRGSSGPADEVIHRRNGLSAGARLTDACLSGPGRGPGAGGRGLGAGGRGPGAGGWGLQSSRERAADPNRAESAKL